jgi:Domain of unknown function (DUF1330)
MPKAYAVVTYRSVSDPEKLAGYAKLAGPSILSFGARFLARGNAVIAREQGVKTAPWWSNILAWKKLPLHTTAPRTRRHWKRWGMVPYAIFGSLKE